MEILLSPEQAERAARVAALAGGSSKSAPLVMAIGWSRKDQVLSFRAVTGDRAAFYDIPGMDILTGLDSFTADFDGEKFIKWARIGQGVALCDYDPIGNTTVCGYTVPTVRLNITHYGRNMLPSNTMPVGCIGSLYVRRAEFEKALIGLKPAVASARAGKGLVKLSYQAPDALMLNTWGRGFNKLFDAVTVAQEGVTPTFCASLADLLSACRLAGGDIVEIRLYQVKSRTSQEPALRLAVTGEDRQAEAVFLPQSPL